jgi:uncharacterized integral membrane protein
MKTPMPEPKVEKSKSNLVRILIIIGSLIVGVILAIFSMSNNPR